MAQHLPQPVLRDQEQGPDGVWGSAALPVVHTYHYGGDRRLGEDIHGQGKHLLEPETQGAGERNTPRAGK